MSNVTRICSVNGCERGGLIVRGMCRAHYRRVSRHGTTDSKQGRWRGSIAERVAAGVVKMSSGCLEWSGSPDRYGYGRARVNGKTIGAHRIAWELVNGPIPDGMCVCHHCDNPLCCETAPSEEYHEGHLFLGTKAENSADTS